MSHPHTIARACYLNMQASADKLIREMDIFGPDFEHYEEPASTTDEAEAEREEQAAVGPEKDKSKAKKGKLAAKSTGLTYQFQILESIGIPRSEIKKFADPLHWLTHFPPIAIVSDTCSTLICFPCSAQPPSLDLVSFTHELL